MKNLIRKRLLLAILLTLLLLTGLSIAQADDQPSTLEIHFIDVGMGDAMLLLQRIDGELHAMMIDTGDRGTSSLVTNYVLAQQIESLDYLVLTHPHADHIGGAASLLETLKIGTVYMTNTEADSVTYQHVMDTCRQKGIVEVYPAVGDTFAFGDAIFTVYAPHPVLYDAANDWSLVLMMDFHGTRVLFTGDAEVGSENDMLGDPTLDLRADVLKVGHHGSSTSSSFDFVCAVSPSYAVISCGESSSYEYPNVEVAMNLMDAGVQDILTTKTSGTIICTIQQDGVFFFDSEKKSTDP